MPIFDPVNTSAPPPRPAMRLISFYWNKAGDIAKYDGRSQFSVMARILYARVRYGFGAEFYDLRRFNSKPLSTYRDFLPMEERDRLLARANPREYRHLCDNKVYLYEHCVANGIATGKLFGLILKSANSANAQSIVPSATDSNTLDALLRQIPDGQYVMKPIDGAHGWGVALINIRGGVVTTSSGQVISAKELFEECAAQAYTREGFLIQEYLTAHKELLPLMPGPGLGSFRIITFIQPGPKVTIYYAEVKIPGEGKITSNFSGGEGGSFVCQINIASGKISYALAATARVPITTVISRHPTTGVQLQGVQIPLWQEAMELVRRGAMAFGGLKTLGWDIAITDRGPMVLETNWGYGHDTMEMTLNRGLRTEFRALIESTLT